MQGLQEQLDQANEAYEVRSKMLLPTALALLVAGSIAGITFLLDVSSERNFAGGVFPYFVLILVSIWVPWRTAPFAFAALSSFLACLGYFVTINGVDWLVIANRAFILSALWITAWLVYLRQVSVHELHASNNRLECEIAERQQAEQAVRDSETLLRQAAQQAQLGAEVAARRAEGLGRGRIFGRIAGDHEFDHAGNVGAKVVVGRAGRDVCGQHGRDQRARRE